MLSLSLCGVNAFAVESNSETVLSFEQYYSELKAEYKKYNIEYTIIEYDDSYVFTQELLNTEKRAAKEFAESITITCEEVTPTSKISPRIIPTNYICGQDWKITSSQPISWATFRTYTSGQLDLQGDSVMSASASASFVSGVNYASHSLSVAAYPNNPSRGYVTWHATGSILFQWTEAHTGVSATRNVPVDYAGGFKASSYT